MSRAAIKDGEQTKGGSGPNATLLTANGPVSLGFGGKRGKGRNGWDGLGAQEGWGLWSGQGNTADPSFSTGAGEESPLCAAV